MDDLRVCKLNGGDLAGVSWLTQGVLGSPCKLHPVLGLEDPVLEPHAVCAHSLEAIDAVATADGLLKFTIRYKRITCVTLHHVSNINSGGRGDWRLAGSGPGLAANNVGSREGGRLWGPEIRVLM